MTFSRDINKLTCEAFFDDEYILKLMNIVPEQFLLLRKLSNQSPPFDTPTDQDIMIRHWTVGKYKYEILEFKEYCEDEGIDEAYRPTYVAAMRIVAALENGYPHELVIEMAFRMFKKIEGNTVLTQTITEAEAAATEAEFRKEPHPVEEEATEYAESVESEGSVVSEY